jgi:hypothetical protein
MVIVNTTPISIFLTGYDPRFEEALLILSLEQRPALVVGNEGLDYSAIIPFNLQKVLFQSFSLVGQPRGKSKSLKEIYQSAGIQKIVASVSLDGNILFQLNLPIPLKLLRFLIILYMN